jgi:hypothetical protein
LGIYFIDLRAAFSAIAVCDAHGFKTPVTPGTFCLIHISFFLYSYNFTAKRRLQKKPPSAVF